MKKLFSTYASNDYQSLLLRDFSQWALIDEFVNRKPMPAGGLSANFHFDQREGFGLPDICTVCYSGVLAFRGDLKDKIFPHPADELEFLHINVENSSWLLLSCLRAASEIDLGYSDVARGLSGEIFYVVKVRVTDLRAKAWEMFTLKDSNRAQLFVTNEFRERVEKLGLKGIEFKEVGEII